MNKHLPKKDSSGSFSPFSSRVLVFVALFLMWIKPSWLYVLNVFIFCISIFAFSQHSISSHQRLYQMSLPCISSLSFILKPARLFFHTLSPSPFTPCLFLVPPIQSRVSVGGRHHRCHGPSQSAFPIYTWCVCQRLRRPGSQPCCVKSAASGE